MPEVLKMDETMQEYLSDESRRTGKADSISFPESESDIIEVMKEMYGKGTAVTVQGSLTGITGGGVPDEGHILNTSKMKGLTETGNQNTVKVQPGLLLEEFNSGYCRDRNMFFPPDPTEKTASFGGMAANDASGARSFRYGSVRKYIKSLRMVLADGDVMAVNRGDKCNGRSFKAVTEGGRKIEGNLPSYTMPAVKNAAGYHVEDDMDLIDLFIGSEGTLGIISEIEISLLKMPRAVWGITAFFYSEQEALEFVHKLRKVLRPCAIEYLDGASLELIGKASGEQQSNDIPVPCSRFESAVYMEFHGDGDEQIMTDVEGMMKILVDCGSDPETAWTVTDERGLEKSRLFRHAVPEQINSIIGRRQKESLQFTKLGTDMAVPDRYLEEMMGAYRTGLGRTSLESAVFGHIGDNHLHVNIIPGSMEEYHKGTQLCLEWARKAVSMGGTVSAEHGTGKIKKQLLSEMYGEQGIREIKGLKQLFDPNMILGRGNLF